MLICLRNCQQKYFLSMKQTEVLRLLPERDLCPRRLLQSIYRQRIFNRPFYWYGCHIELLRFKEDYGGHEHDPFTRSVLTGALLGQFLFKFSWRKIVMGKKIVVPRLDVIMISFFPRNTRWSSLSECPPGHPILLLKSKKFNMAAVSVKRSIWGILSFCLMVPLHPPPPPASETGMTNNQAYLTSSGINVRVISSSFFRFSLSLNNLSKTTRAINSRNFESFLGRAHRTTP